MLKKIFSHTAIYGLAPHISKIAGLFVLPVITQDLTELDYGVFGIIMAFAGSVEVLSALGLRVVIINSFYRVAGHYKWAWRQIYGFLICWSVPYAIVLSVLLLFIIPEEAAANRWTIILLSVSPIVLFGQTAMLGAAYYQVNQKPVQIGIRTGITGLITVFLNLFTISYLQMGYMGWFWSVFIATTLMNISYWFPLNMKLGIRPIFNFKWRFIRKSLKVSLPTVPHYYSGYLLNSSDRIVMDFLKVSTGNIGKFNMAYTFGSYFQSLGTAAGMAISPLLNEYYKKGDDKGARNLIFLMQTAFLAGTTLISIWLREIFLLLIRNDVLNKTYPLAIIILMSYNYRPMYMGANNKLFYAEKTHILWRVTFTAGAFNVVSNLILIPVWGFEIAAVTTFIALMYMGYVGYSFKVFRELNTATYFPLRWLSLTVLLTVICYYVVDLSYMIKGVISLLILLVGLLGIRTFNKKLEKDTRYSSAV